MLRYLLDLMDIRGMLFLVSFVITGLRKSGISTGVGLERLSGELCDTEAFQAECLDSEVILMTRASYGRMRLGRCVGLELGYIGCYTDIITMMDRRCSGKRVCSVRVPDAQFESTRPCLKELKNYMEGGYQCVPVVTVTSEYCEKNKDLDVMSLTAEPDSQQGYIANIVTSDTPSCDGATHPWLIRAAPGQKINITLFNFALENNNLVSQQLAISSLSSSSSSSSSFSSSSESSSTYQNLPSSKQTKQSPTRRPRIGSKGQRTHRSYKTDAEEMYTDKQKHTAPQLSDEEHSYLKYILYEHNIERRRHDLNSHASNYSTDCNNCGTNKYSSRHNKYYIKTKALKSSIETNPFILLSANNISKHNQFSTTDAANSKLKHTINETSNMNHINHKHRTRNHANSTSIKSTLMRENNERRINRVHGNILKTGARQGGGIDRNYNLYYLNPNQENLNRGTSGEFLVDEAVTNKIDNSPSFYHRHISHRLAKNMQHAHERTLNFTDFLTRKKRSDTLNKFIKDSNNSKNFYNSSNSFRSKTHRKRSPVKINSGLGKKHKDNSRKHLQQTNNEECVQYGLIQDGLVNSPTSICGGTQRVSHVYMSKSNLIRIWVTAGSAPNDLKRFLLKYTILGCPRLVLPDHATIESQSDDGQLIRVRCQYSVDRWRLECVNNVWKGHVDDIKCPSPSSGKESKPVSNVSPLHKNQNSSYGRNVITGVIVCTVISITVLLLLIIFIKCRRYNQSPT